MKNCRSDLLLALACTFTVVHVAYAADAEPPALLNAKGCVACHDVSTKKVGPSFKDVATKYAGQKGAVDKLTTKVLEGGAGVWGPVAMPPNKAMGVSPAEARQLVTWVMSLNSGTAPGGSTGKKSK